jgi:hypothetical protein
MVEWYSDEPQYLATVVVNGRRIKLRSTPEYEAFLDSLFALTDAEELLAASVWVEQKANQCIRCPELLIAPPQEITVQGRRIPPFSTPAGESFFTSLKDLADEERRIAVGEFLHVLARQLFANAALGRPAS